MAVLVGRYVKSIRGIDDATYGVKVSVKKREASDDVFVMSSQFHLAFLRNSKLNRNIIQLCPFR